MRDGIQVAVVVASAGRPDAAAQLLDILNSLREVPEIFLSVPSPEDAPRTAANRSRVLVGTRGASAQRNAALNQISPDTDYVFFFDDDALPRQDYLENMVQFLEINTGVVAATGNVIADGAPAAREIQYAAAIEALDTSYTRYPEGESGRSNQQDKLYGCNFVVRWKQASDLRFDERLPLYSWLEDYDYARRIGLRGTIVRLSGCIAIHRGSASGGRESHLRFGYSQVANPVYLRRKASFTMSILAREVLRPVLKNLLLAILPGEQKPWRRQRLRGNYVAVKDLAGARLEPERILELGA